MLLNVLDTETLQMFVGFIELPRGILVRYRDSGVDRPGRGSVFSHVFEDVLLI
jgi:hypothetical protein